MVSHSAANLKTMVDSDGDNVNNRLDLEPNTPKGFPVNVRGIALDSDSDGVLDGADKQNDTHSRRKGEFLRYWYRF